MSEKKSKLEAALDRHIADGKPALEALPGGKNEQSEAKSAVRTEADLRKALASLIRRHAVQKATTCELSIGRGDWRAVADGAADLRKLEGQIETLQYVLSIRENIT